MLFGSPAGIGFASQQAVHVSATQHVNVVSGQSTHMATGKSLLASVGEKLSLFVQNAGMKLFAAKGKVQVQAQSDNIELTAQKTVKVLSTTAKVEVAADQGILLASGGAYIRIAGGNIEVHAPGTVDIKGAQHAWNGPASMGYPLPSSRPDQPGQLALLHKYLNDEPVKTGAFSVLDANGAVLKQGALDAGGHTVVGGLPAGAALVRFGGDPRQQDQTPSRFKMPVWPEEPGQEAAGGAGADASVAGAAQGQMGGFLPMAGGAASAGGLGGIGALAGSAMNGAAGLATAVSAGRAGLMQAAARQGLGLAQQALGKGLPAGARSVLAQASGMSSTAKQAGGLVEGSRGNASMLKSF
jgi:type VI secretion system secreted protein VgrG